MTNPAELEIKLIQLYRKVSHPVYRTLDKFHINPLGCRYTPSCSHYTEEAIRKYGLVKGSLMGVYRILRCNPFSKGGEDPLH